MLKSFSLGTMGFVAPEILQLKPYQGPAVDIFSLGVILFFMFVGHPPFNEACQNDGHYKLMFQNEVKIFWKHHQSYT